jgi:hypothetical protein
MHPNAPTCSQTLASSSKAQRSILWAASGVQRLLEPKVAASTYQDIRVLWLAAAVHSASYSWLVTGSTTTHQNCSIAQPCHMSAADWHCMAVHAATSSSSAAAAAAAAFQALELGYWLRQQYIDTHGFLPASLKPGVVAARTTNFSRTRATLAGVLTGLYPGGR